MRLAGDGVHRRENVDPRFSVQAAQRGPARRDDAQSRSAGLTGVRWPRSTAPYSGLIPRASDDKCPTGRVQIDVGGRGLDPGDTHRHDRPAVGLREQAEGLALLGRDTRRQGRNPGGQPAPVHAVAEAVVCRPISAMAVIWVAPGRDEPSSATWTSLAPRYQKPRPGGRPKGSVLPVTPSASWSSLSEGRSSSRASTDAPTLVWRPLRSVVMTKWIPLAGPSLSNAPNRSTRRPPSS